MHNGTAVAVQQGRPIAVILAGNPTTGYQWSLESVSGTSIVAVGEGSYVANSGGGVGGGGRYTFSFEAKAVGSSDVKLIYKRSWEDAAINTYSVTLNVSAN